MKALILIILVLTILIGSEKTIAQPSVGDPVINFALPAWDNSGTVALNNYSGDIIVLNFFASWCVPCQTEAPLLQDSIWQNYTGQDVTVIGLAQEPYFGMDVFINDFGLTYPIALDTAGVFFKAYAFQIIPSNILVNRDGTIIFIEEGFDIPLFAHLIDSLLGTTAIEAGTTDEIFYPDKLSLQGSYPNPFNSETKIEFSLTTSEFVNLSIYTLTGQRIIQTENYYSAGRHVIPVSMNHQASGIYLFALQAGKEKKFGKLVLSK
jgi:peroxiredoxin